MDKEQKDEFKKELTLIRRALLNQLLNSMTQKELGQKTGLTGPQISRLANPTEKEKKRTFTDNNAHKIEQALDLPVGWLSNPENLTNPQQAFLKSKTQYQAELSIVRQPELIPLLTTDLACEYLADTHRVGVREYINSTIYHSNQAIAITMPDDSMCNPAISPSLCKGDILIIEPNITPLSGDIVLVQPSPDRKESIFAQLHTEPNGSRYLKHTNPTAPSCVALPEKANILGVVIERQTRLFSSTILNQRVAI